MHASNDGAPCQLSNFDQYRRIERFLREYTVRPAQCLQSAKSHRPVIRLSTVKFGKSRLAPLRDAYDAIAQLRPVVLTATKAQSQAVVAVI
jgi:hypothetical protein